MNNPNPVTTNTSEVDEQSKQSYTKPVLVCHGTIAQIVQRAGAAGTNDGGFFAS